MGRILILNKGILTKYDIDKRANNQVSSKETENTGSTFQCKEHPFGKQNEIQRDFLVKEMKQSLY